MNWIDTPLLVYAAVEDHPARPIIAQELRSGAWASSLLVLLEVHQILQRSYGMSASAAGHVAEDLLRLPLHWASVDPLQVAEIIPARSQYRIESTDAALLVLAREDHGILLTPDRRLLRLAQELGIAARNPITPDLSNLVQRWEETHLPPRGVPRVLGVVERWIRRGSPTLADEFRLATDNLRVLPL